MFLSAKSDISRLNYTTDTQLLSILDSFKRMERLFSLENTHEETTLSSDEDAGYVHLPIEILERIVSYLPTKGLVAFSLTSMRNRIMVLD